MRWEGLKCVQSVEVSPVLPNASPEDMFLILSGSLDPPTRLQHLGGFVIYEINFSLLRYHFRLAKPLAFASQWFFDTSLSR